MYMISADVWKQNYAGTEDAGILESFDMIDQFYRAEMSPFVIYSPEVGRALVVAHETFGIDLH